MSVQYLFQQSELHRDYESTQSVVAVASIFWTLKLLPQFEQVLLFSTIRMHHTRQVTWRELSFTAAVFEAAAEYVEEY